MRELIIQIQQSLDNDRPKDAKQIAKRILTPTNVSKMLSTTVDEVRALLVWAQILSGDIEEARKLASQIEGQKKRAGEERNRTASAAWVQIISDEIDDPNSNKMRWFEESAMLWRDKLKSNPQDDVAREAMKKAQAKAAALFPGWHARQLRIANQQAEALGHPSISS